MARGLSLFLLLHALDSVHNMNPIMATPLIGGSLVGLFLGRRSARVEIDPPRAGMPWSPRPARLAPLLLTVVILAALEVLGRWPRPIPTAAGTASAKSGSPTPAQMPETSPSH